MLKILGEMTRATPAQLRKAEALLRRAGYKVEAPVRWNGGQIAPPPGGFNRRRPAPGQTTPLPLPGWEERPRVATRDTSEDDLLAGTMYEVQSSNVHSIGMRIDSEGDSKGTLLVRFLGQHAEGIRAGLGSLYGYFDVPVALFREFQRAASKGGFVWDHLRVRGTIAGHRYQYELLGVTSAYAGGQQHENYVPRQAALKRGAAGQHFITRTFGVGEIRGGRLQTVRVQSQLRPGMASLRGPNPTRGPGSSALRFQGGQ